MFIHQFGREIWTQMLNVHFFPDTLHKQHLLINDAFTWMQRFRKRKGPLHSPSCYMGTSINRTFVVLMFLFSQCNVCLFIFQGKGQMHTFWLVRYAHDTYDKVSFAE